jgi:hypothetical protein
MAVLLLPLALGLVGRPTAVPNVGTFSGTSSEGEGKMATSSALAVARSVKARSLLVEAWVTVGGGDEDEEKEDEGGGGKSALREVHQSPVGRCCTSAYLRLRHGFNLLVSGLRAGSEVVVERMVSRSSGLVLME